MKKFLLYTLILVMLVGIFNPISLYATTEYCREILPPNAKYTFAYPPNNTPEKCRALNTSNPPVYEWFVDTPLPVPTYPTCSAGIKITDGWGWENNKTCKADTSTSTPSPTPTTIGTCTHTTPVGTTTTRKSIRSLCVEPDNWQLDSTSLPTPTPGPSYPPTTPTTPTQIDPNYILLAPLPCDPNKDGLGCIKDPKSGQFVLNSFDPTDDSGGTLGKYLNMMIRLFIGICGVLAVIMIVMGGVEYMTSELISSKEAGKERITNALFGLLLALGAWTLLNTINPNILISDLKISAATVNISNQIRNYSGKGECKPITSGICSPANLAAAGFTGVLAVQASSICNGESGGIPNLGSGVDKCSDKNSFSFGLFQINIIAHSNEIKDQSGNLICSGIFQGNTQGTCMPGKSKDGICFERNCKVINPTQYQKCIAYITNPTNNIAYAKGLQAINSGWGQWGAYNSCKNTFPPK